MTITTPGFYHDMTEAVYHSDPAPVPSLSSSCAKTLVTKSPLHAFTEHPRLGGVSKPDTDEMDYGSLAHKLILGKGADLAILDGDSWRGKEAAKFWDEAKAAGKIPVLPKTLERAREMVKAVLSQLPDMGLNHITQDGRAEVCGFWKEGDSWCRFMADRLIIDEARGKATIWDWKTMSQSTHPKACAARIASMGYDLQRAHYIQGVQALRPDLAGRISFNFAFIETAPPFAVTPVELDGEWTAVGVSKWVRALAKWQECTASGSWPGYTSEILRLEAPPWALAQEMGAE